MIRISCTNCKTILSIDDAFAGGVCRCQHCGTIQTVPAQSRGNVAVSAGGHAIGGAKSLYHSSEPQAAAGTGLDDLASIVVSSGLTSNRLRKPKAGGSKSNLLLPVLIGSGILLIGLIFVIIYLLNRNPTVPQGGAATAGTGSVNGTSAAPAPSPASPNFCGVPLTGNTVVYLLDHGDATRDFLGDLKAATIKSARTLTPDRKFAILFWSETDGQSPVVGYPEKTTAYATDESINSADKAIADVGAHGQPEISAALRQAIELNPDEIVIATGKGMNLNLDNAWLDEVLKIRGDSKVKIDTISLGADGEITPLKRLAEQTGGTYKELTKGDLAGLMR